MLNHTNADHSSDEQTSDHVDYWAGEIRAFLDKTTDYAPDDEIGLTERYNANDVVLTPVGGSTEGERASLIRELELGGFEVTSTARERYIHVDAPADRLPSDYTDAEVGE